MLVTMIVVTALLAGTVVLVSMQMSSTRSASITADKTASLYCAEAGLTAARPIVATNYGSWATALAMSNGDDLSEPPWLAAGIGSHDLDGDTVADFSVYLLDNDDEVPTTDRAADSDLKVFIVARCNKYPDTPQEIRELVLFNGATQCYPWQLGGCGNDGNTN